MLDIELYFPSLSFHVISLTELGDRSVNLVSTGKAPEKGIGKDFFWAGVKSNNEKCLS